MATKMTTIPIQLRDEDADRLGDLAKRLGVSIEDLARVGVLEMLSRPDGDFEEVARSVLQKNAELYRRLA